MEVLEEKSPVKRIQKVRSLIESAGNKIGSVHFTRRSDGKKRKMSYRLHVKNPSYAAVPKGLRRGNLVSASVSVSVSGAGKDGKASSIFNDGSTQVSTTKTFRDKKNQDEKNNLLTVFDVNKVLRDKDGRICGRGGYKSIPLENVIRIKANGVITKIKK